MVRVERLTQPQEAEYDALLRSSDTALLYASLPYRRFLQTVLQQSEPTYLVAYEGGRMMGALPAFLAYNPIYGNVLNSLPFYGSNGGVTVSPEASDPQGIRLALVDAFASLAKEHSVVASTLISNPLAADAALYEAHAPYTLRDERIGQVTALPPGGSGEGDLRDLLIAKFHQKTRNAIRKAQSGGVTVSHSDSPEALHTLAELHRQSIAAIGGLPKPLAAFLALRAAFTYDRDYRVYLAQRDGAVIAVLLVFFFHRTAEYHTPATAESFRIYQPMSLLVYEAMREAARRGCRYWNWGGTWTTQRGVYNFKKRWGTQDRPYFYFTRILDEKILDATREQLVAAYPYFYVAPFRSLKPEHAYAP